MYDYHVHSSFSEDCDIEMESMIKSAIDMGFKEIAITDHLDLDYPDRNFQFLLDFSAYQKALNQYMKQYAGKIKVVKGIEMGLQKHILSECEQVVDSFEYDFVLASFHGTDQKDLHCGDYFKERSPLNCYIDYYTNIYDCLSDYKKYNVIAHINLVDRYAHYIENDNVKLSQYMEIVEGIFKKIIDDGKGIEINTSCGRYQMKKTIPTVEMLKLYKDLNGEIITMGSDAHYKNHIGYDFNYYFDLLKSLGFRYITAFDKMKPAFIKI